MTFRETSPLSIPDHLHRLPLNEGLLKICGFEPGAQSAEYGLSHLKILATTNADSWVGLATHPSVPVNGIEDVFGSFLDDEPISGKKILSRAEDWIRNSDNITFVPGRMIETPSSTPEIVIGHILVRTTLYQ